MSKHSIQAQISEVERELKMRAKVYPRQIGAGKAFRSQAEADMHVAIMETALETLNWVKDNRADLVEWIAAGKPKAAKPKEDAA
jgi:hypothetical protein